ncbi:MAG TPA: metal-binding protein [Thiothrix sp.]|nr:metal-binding protein [Thiothrix sp.]
MLARLPVEVNPYRLIEQRRNLQGELALQSLSRLQEYLFNADDQQGQVRVELIFAKNDLGLPTIRGTISAPLVLQCQRCLTGLDYPLHSTIDIVLIRHDAEADRLDEGYDTWLVEDERIFLQDFVEDELLLALPYAPTHTDCEASQPLIEITPEAFAAQQATNQQADNSLTKNQRGIADTADDNDHADPQNPFALLKQWQNKQNDAN